jgi:diadenosine tetraphosphatase ApaH/serine/threonine PP2A family protein phosphatase
MHEGLSHLNPSDQMDQSAFVQDFSRTLDQAKRELELERSRGKIRGGIIRSGTIELEIPENLVIVGDIHGDLDTLQKVFDSIRVEEFARNPANKIVFLGDYIDRGTDSIRVLYSILKLKINHLDSVVLMRGNHEAPVQFPFASHSLSLELRKEFPKSSPKLYQKILRIFDLLTVVTIVKRSLILVHGGLPVFCPTIAAGSAESTLGQKAALEQLLWNDPRDSIEDARGWERSRRGFGYHFGPNVTKAWLSALDVKLLIRGHEPCAGVKTIHNSQVLTLFSSKQAYPAFKAAYIQISGQGVKSLKDNEDIARCARFV